MSYSAFKFEHEGHKFSADDIYDEGMGAPWEEHDGHGIVSDWTTRAKRPGELVLCSDHGSKRFYDFQASVKRARAEGWDAAPYGGTKGERAHRATLADFEHLKAWCEDRWHWCCVTVALLDDYGDEMGETASLGGIESSSTEYLKEAAEELAGEILWSLSDRLKQSA